MHTMHGLYFTTTYATGQSELLLISNLSGPVKYDSNKSYAVAWTLFDEKKQQADGMLCQNNFKYKGDSDHECLGFSTYDKVYKREKNQEIVEHVKFCAS